MDPNLVIAIHQEQEAERRSYDLREAEAEITRHHSDFEKISSLLDNFFSKEPLAQLAEHHQGSIAQR